MTHRYLLTITLAGAASPASARERGFVTSTYDYLPGSVLRGARGGSRPVAPRSMIPTPSPSRWLSCVSDPGSLSVRCACH
jgi:hypothetical protein